MTKQSRVDRLAALEALWLHLRNPGFVEFNRPNGKPISVNPNFVYTVRPGPDLNPQNVRIVLPEPAGEIIVDDGLYPEILEKLRSSVLLPGNMGVEGG